MLFIYAYYIIYANYGCMWHIVRQTEHIIKLATTTPLLIFHLFLYETNSSESRLNK